MPAGGAGMDSGGGGALGWGMATTNLAVISTAHIHTKSFLDNIAKAGDGRTAYAIWDDVEERGRRYATQAGCRFEADLARLVADPTVDGFIICAENTRHLPLLERVLPSGKPVFCEKPLVTTRADAARLRPLLAGRGAPLFCGYFNPFSADMRAVAGLIAAGAFGKVTHVRFRNAHHAAYGRWFDNPDLRWFTDPALAGGGAFMDMGTHAVHLLRHLFGPVAEVSAVIANRCGAYPAVDDHGLAWLRFQSGVLGTVEAAWIHNGGPTGLEIAGDQLALWHDGKRYVTGKPGQEAQPLPATPGAPDRVDRLVAAIRGQLSAADLAADLAACLDSVAIMEAAYVSAKAGGWQKV